MTEQLTQAELLQIQADMQFLTEVPKGAMLQVDGEIIMKQPAELRVLQLTDEHKNTSARQYEVQYTSDPKSKTTISWANLREWAVTGLIRLLMQYPVGTSVRIMDEKSNDITRILNWPYSMLTEFKKLDASQKIGLEFADDVHGIKRIDGLPVRAFASFYMASMRPPNVHMEETVRHLSEFPNVHGFQMGMVVGMYDEHSDPEGDGVLFHGMSIAEALMRKIPPERYEAFFKHAEETLKALRDNAEKLVGPIGGKTPDIVLVKR